MERFSFARIVIGISIIIVIGSILYYLGFYKKGANTDGIKPTENENNTKKSQDNLLPEKILLNKPPAYEKALFFEELPVIQGQQAYIAYPLEIDVENPPVLVIYSHGSNTRVTTDMKDPFMKDLREYGDFFTKNGYVFAASDEHGANWGSDSAVDDIVNLIEWLSENYPIAQKVNLLGYSMGGLAVLRFSFKYPERVNKIALLASTTWVEEWGREEVNSIMSIDIKIWHGDKDVNVPMAFSTEFVDLCKRYGKVIELEVVRGAGHFDIDTELKDRILDFFKK